MTSRPPHVHLIGALGQGMASLGRLYRHQGWTVSGCDVRATAETPEHAPEHIDTGLDLVVRSLAVPSNHPEVEAARRIGIGVRTRPVALADLLKQTSEWVAGVSGVTGKSSTTFLAAQMLQQNGLAPTVYVGADVPGNDDPVRPAGGGSIAVVEACEVEKGMMALQPDCAVVTSHYWGEHPASYPTSDSLTAAFADFAAGAPNAVLPSSEKELKRQVLYRSQPRIITFGTDRDASVHLESYRATSSGFRARYRIGGKSIMANTRLFGNHNAVNLSAAMACYLTHADDMSGLTDVDFARLTVPRRRMEYLGRTQGIHFFDDYGHNPVQIEAAVAILRERFPRAVLGAFYLPSGFQRLSAFEERYADSLSSFYTVVLAPPIAGFEDVDTGGNPRDFSAITVERLRAAGRRALIRNLPDVNLSDFKYCDVVCFFGAMRMNGFLPGLLAKGIV